MLVSYIYITLTNNLKAHFLPSPDDDFAPRGAVSGIDYEGDFHKYKMLLTAKADSKNIKKLYKFYDTYIFGTNTPHTAALDNAEDECGELEAAMRGIDDDDDDNTDNTDNTMASTSAPYDMQEYDDEEDEDGAYVAMQIQPRGSQNRAQGLPLDAQVYTSSDDAEDRHNSAVESGDNDNWMDGPS